MPEARRQLPKARAGEQEEEEERGIREHLGRLTPFQTNLDPDRL